MARFAWTSCALAALLLGALPAAAQQVIGVSAAVKNDVRNRKVGAPIPRPVQVKDRIALADQLQTGAKSQLQVLLLDKSVFTVGANARLTVDKYVYDPASNNRSLGATVARGAFRFMSGAPDRGTGSQIRTPIATIGIRGTIVEGVVGEEAVLISGGEAAIGRNVQSDPDTASLIILRGPGNATQGSVLPGSITVTAGGRTVAVDRPMLAVYVPGPGMAPIGPFRISQFALSQIQALLYPSVADRLGLLGPADNLGTGQTHGTYFPPSRDGPAYPDYPPGAYPPGAFPPGGFPPGRLPGGGAPPGAGVPGVGVVPGTGIPNIPRGGLPPRRPLAAGGAAPAGAAANNVQGTQGNPAAANNGGGGPAKTVGNTVVGAGNNNNGGGAGAGNPAGAANNNPPLNVAGAPPTNNVPATNVPCRPTANVKCPPPKKP